MYGMTVIRTPSRPLSRTLRQASRPAGPLPMPSTAPMRRPLRPVRTGFGLSELIVHTPDCPLTVPLYAGWDASHYARSAIHALVEGLRTHCDIRMRRFPGL